MLNGVLPKDTRIVGWCPVPSDFGARFKGHQLCAIKIKGSAFLLHQVCCMVAVLLMIGQGLESPELIDALLDTWKDTKETPLSHGSRNSIGSSSCEFEALKFACSSGVTEFVHRCWTSSAWSLGE
ncbi:hypothetical protein D5086_011255 [Populus alba]|uniref:Uncharacterized protein n=1 Tax=Populus alba TaxID=43335 RepID=A0ACC4CCW4_POPAL